jgi:hypothetical protein
MLSIFPRLCGLLPNCLQRLPPVRMLALLLLLLQLLLLMMLLVLLVVLLLMTSLRLFNWFTTHHSTRIYRGGGMLVWRSSNLCAQKHMLPGVRQLLRRLGPRRNQGSPEGP